MTKPSTRLAGVIAKLRKRYGAPSPPPVKGAFELVVWEKVAYLATDERRAAAAKKQLQAHLRHRRPGRRENPIAHATGSGHGPGLERASCAHAPRLRQRGQDVCGDVQVRNRCR